MLGLAGIAQFGLCCLTTSPRPGPQPIDPTKVDLDKSGRRPQIHKTILSQTLGTLLTQEPFSLPYQLDGGGQVLIPGLQALFLCSTWNTILGWSMVSKDVGSIRVDIWKRSLSSILAGTPISVADSIVGGNCMEISAGISAQSFVLSNWSVELEANDVVAFSIVSASGMFVVDLILECRRRRLAS